MPKNSKLLEMMREDLPNVSSQKRLHYRTTKREVIELYNIINKEIFENKLTHPNIVVMSRCRKFWGYCIADDFPDDNAGSKSFCTIKLSDKWYCKQWLITTLAHEMCHQYQWDIDSYTRKEKGLQPIISHGPSFFKFKHELQKHGISLKRSHSIRKWFKFQNLFKC